MSAVVLALGSFLAMEVVSYAGHRWVMHGVGMGWHRSHHLPPAGRTERNDLFPASFSMVGFLLFLAASLGVADWLWPVAIGVTAYGACYLFVHEVYIHRRIRVALPHLRYFEWLRSSHADHHRRAGEPYGMLLPFRRDRSSGDRDTAAAVDRSVARRSARDTRSRL